MKKLFVVLINIGLFTVASAQKKNTYSIGYNIATGADILTIPSLKGAGTENVGSITSFGFSFLHATKKKLKLETGLKYSKFNCSFTPPYNPGVDLTPQPYSIQLLTIPILARFDFWKYCYFKTGIIGDVELQHENSKVSNQTGIGFNFGVGLHYNYKNIAFQLNPYLQTHSNIAFQRDRYQYHLFESGIQLCIGIKL